MRLTAWEEERLLIFSAAELARRHRDVGLLLNHPEAVALICDAMLEAARAGGGYEDVQHAGRSAVSRDELMPGVDALLDEIRLEVLLGDGTRLVVVRDPVGPAEPGGPGDVVRSTPRPDATAGLDRRTIEVTNEGTHIVRVSSHYPFHLVNHRLRFDRSAARGFRLDLPAGFDERWAPGETKRVSLVAFRGDAGAHD